MEAISRFFSFRNRYNFGGDENRDGTRFDDLTDDACVFILKHLSDIDRQIFRRSCGRIFTLVNHFFEIELEGSNDNFSTLSNSTANNIILSLEALSFSKSKIGALPNFVHFSSNVVDLHLSGAMSPDSFLNLLRHCTRVEKLWVEELEPYGNGEEWEVIVPGSNPMLVRNDLLITETDGDFVWLPALKNLSFLSTCRTKEQNTNHDNKILRCLAWLTRHSPIETLEISALLARRADFLHASRFVPREFLTGRTWFNALNNNNFGMISNLPWSGIDYMLGVHGRKSLRFFSMVFEIKKRISMKFRPRLPDRFMEIEDFSARGFSPLSDAVFADILRSIHNRNQLRRLKLSRCNLENTTMTIFKNQLFGNYLDFQRNSLRHIHLQVCIRDVAYAHTHWDMGLFENFQNLQVLVLHYWPQKKSVSRSFVTAPQLQNFNRLPPSLLKFTTSFCICCPTARYLADEDLSRFKNLQIFSMDSPPWFFLGHGYMKFLTELTSRDMEHLRKCMPEALIKFNIAPSIFL